MHKTADKFARSKSYAVFVEWFRRTDDYRAAAARAGVSSRTGLRWAARHAEELAASARPAAQALEALKAAKAANTTTPAVAARAPALPARPELVGRAADLANLA